jgi:hypothetical protein
MGLDMYLNGEKFFWTNWKEPEKNFTIDGFKVNTQDLRLGYWRKHPNLHGYIVETFANGEDECQRIELSAENIKKIIAAVKENKLPHTEGFFFGSSEGIEAQETIDIFTKALEWESTKEKNVSRRVYYQASW